MFVHKISAPPTYIHSFDPGFIDMMSSLTGLPAVQISSGG